ncbi:hypothetical protein EYF80_000567 [Liparis tanakae]|uniref:Uncharacterized protein n=1 Tax=Liparis tanakae TaxID=230148 RepID=A0A4Z2JG87_9TELE|nr:hypothetical protein EYF80_000567 [Liparis tanakae]
MKPGMLWTGVALDRGEESQGSKGRELVIAPMLAIYVIFVGSRGPGGAEQGVLVFAETQNDIDAVDAAPHSDDTSFPHLVEVAGASGAVHLTGSLALSDTFESTLVRPKSLTLARLSSETNTLRAAKSL